MQKSSYLLLDYLTHKGQGGFRVTRKCASLILSHQFEHWIVLDPYCAIYDPVERVVEAAIEPLDGTNFVASESLDRRIGELERSELFIEKVEDGDGTGIEFTEEPEKVSTKSLSSALRVWAERKRSDCTDWKMLDLSNDKSSYSVSVSRSSERLSVLDPDILRLAFMGGYSDVSVKIVGLPEGATVRDAQKTLLQVTSALFFDMDVVRGMAFRLVKLSTSGTMGFKRNATYVDKRLELPRNLYSEAALSLYFYAVSAVGMPLLEFLAYYQAVEHFFPVFSQKDLIGRLKARMADPRFDNCDDRELGSLVQLVRSYGPGSLSERDMLRSTVQAALDLEIVSRFLDADPDRRDFMKRKRSIADVQTVNEENRDVPLVRQIADRVYDIRCRIVHAKSDAGKGTAAPILPSSAEESALTHDVELVRVVAQQVIIAGVTGRMW